MQSAEQRAALRIKDLFVDLIDSDSQPTNLVGDIAGIIREEIARQSAKVRLTEYSTGAATDSRINMILGIEHLDASRDGGAIPSRTRIQVGGGVPLVVKEELPEVCIAIAKALLGSFAD